MVMVMLFNEDEPVSICLKSKRWREAIVELALIGIVMLLLVFNNHDSDPFNKSIHRQRSIYFSSYCLSFSFGLTAGENCLLSAVPPQDLVRLPIISSIIKIIILIITLTIVVIITILHVHQVFLFLLLALRRSGCKSRSGF